MEMMKEQASIEVDPFGLNSDLDVSDAGSFAPQPEQREVIRKEFNFGGGPIVIEATSQDELLQRALDAKEQYLLSQQQYYEEPEFEPPAEEYIVPELSSDEELAMAANWTANPSGHVRRIIESQLGMPFDQFREEFRDLQNFKTTVYLNKIGAELADRHSEDYYPCIENGKKLVGFLARTGRSLTPENYEFAFANIKNELIQPPRAAASDEESGSMSPAMSSSYGNASYIGDDSGMSVEDLVRKCFTIGNLFG